MAELVAADQAGAVEADIKIAQDIARLQAARPFLQRIELPDGIGAPDHGTDGGADNDVGDNAMRNERPDDADMGESTSGPATERQSDHRPPDAAKSYPVAAIGAVLAAPHQILQHRSNLPEGRNPTLYPSLSATAASRQNLPEGWFMPLMRETL